MILELFHGNNETKRTKFYYSIYIPLVFLYVKSHVKIYNIFILGLRTNFNDRKFYYVFHVVEH